MPQRLAALKRIETGMRSPTQPFQRIEHGFGDRGRKRADQFIDAGIS